MNHQELITNNIHACATTCATAFCQKTNVAEAKDDREKKNV